MKRGKNRQTGTVKRKSRIILRIVFILLACGALFFVAKFSYKAFMKKFNSEETVSSLYKFWDEKDYQKVYEISATILEKKFLQNAARTFHGYSSFMLAVAQNENSEVQRYLNEAIINLRIALQYAKDDVVPQIQYMLGKSYFYKDYKDNSSNKDSSSNEHYYYADLAIKYLTLSQEAGFEADDLFEYLGLSYASLGETQLSIESFTRALQVRESDTLLLSIAEQYCNASQGRAATQYLKRVATSTQDDEILMRSLFLLAQILIDEENYDDAEVELNEILAKDPRSADAHYGLGLIYEKKNDMAKARSEWRKALALQGNHQLTRLKMSESR